MKITNSEIIRNGERELIDAITADLDWSAIEAIFKERHKLAIQDDVEYRQGDIVVHGGQVAYQLDFDVRVTLSVLFDRDGNYLSIATSADETDGAEAGAPEAVQADPDNGADSPEIVQDYDGAEEAGEADGSDEPEKAAVPPAVPPIDDMENLVLAGAGEADEEEADTVPLAADPEREPDENISKMAADLADMINEINE